MADSGGGNLRRDAGGRKGDVGGYRKKELLDIVEHMYNLNNDYLGTIIYVRMFNYYYITNLDKLGKSHE